MANGRNTDEMLAMGDKFRIFEAIVIWLGITKHLYFGKGTPQKNKFSSGTIQNMESVREILDKSIAQGGDESDFTIANEEEIYPVSVKAGENISQSKTDILALEKCELYPGRVIKPYLVLMDKAIITEKRKSSGSKERELRHKILEEEGRIYDKKDIDIALQKFQEQFKGWETKEIIEYIDVNILNNTKKWLHIRVHQAITRRNAINRLKCELFNFIIGHKPRSGKSITTLLILSDLIQMKKMKRCLFITSVPETLHDYMKTIRDYLDFNNLSQSRIIDSKNVLEQIPEEFEGILFTSTQFLKMDKEGVKDNWIEKIDADVTVIDESHYGGSTIKTNKKVLKKILKKVSKKNRDNKLLICISGTPNKTKQFYKIEKVYDWSFIDESFMKNISNEDIFQKMVEKHGVEFIECMNSHVLDKDYSKCPVPILIRPEFPESLQLEIDQHNRENNTNLGSDVESFFKLMEQKKKSKADVKYMEKFELEKSASGKKMLKAFLEWYISSNPNTKTVMKEVEDTQSGFNSRISDSDNPHLFIMFLPKVGSIELLQKTLLRFLKENDLWSNYRLSYSNFKSKYAGVSEYDNDISITAFVNSQLVETKREKKDGLILFLGDQGSLGITYNMCDTLFMMDNSQNIDYYIQRIMRALNQDKGKTVGCIVDMNVQRTLMYANHMRKLINKDKTVNDSLYDLITLNIFHFNPKQYNFMNYNKQDISEICSRYSEEIKSQLTDETVMKSYVSIQCEELEKILKDLKPHTNNTKIKLEDLKKLEGLNKNIQKPGKTKKLIIEDDSDEDDKEKEEGEQGGGEGEGGEGGGGEGGGGGEEEEEEEEEQDDKQTNSALFFNKAICLICLITKSNPMNTFQTMYDSLSEKMRNTYLDILLRDISEKEYLEESNIKSFIYTIIMSISEKNRDFVEDIKTIYSSAHGDKLHELIVKNIRPSEKEKKDHAEVSTPTFIVGDKINKVPISFWSAEIVTGKPKQIKMPKILDPCCGKGTYLIPLFDKLFKENIDLFDDEYDCCKAIMTQSLYYADINELNVFLTTEILKCHVQSYCGIEPDYEFNSHVGNVLNMDINKEWNVKGFNMVIGNPPYNDDSGNKGKSHILWDKFVCKALDEWLLPNGYLLYIHPSLWRQKDHMLFTKMTQKQIHYLEIHDVDDGMKAFKCATRYDWYLLENKNCYKDTEIKGEDGITHFINLKEWSFIPNKMFQEIKELVAQNDEPLLDVNYYRSNYGADKSWVAGKMDEIFQYPVVYSINKNNALSLKYSNKNTNGHFGLSKFIFSNGAGFYCDEFGTYGLTQWAYCIYDEPENLKKLETMFRNQNFQKIVEALHLDSSSYNISIMKLFKKDMYKLFM